MKQTNVPKIDRLILHKFDPAAPAPGGIDTCIRGILKYHDPSETIGIVGVQSDSFQASDARDLGKWQQCEV
ncbi:MAG: hypothetical protein DI630_25330, partial [Gordonia sp. (in: high G+C Gram-positive bacteria)]